VSELASIPWTGVRRVLADWAGPGELLDALALDEGYERHWTRRDLELRASWLNFLRLQARLSHLPGRRSDWLRAMPATNRRHRYEATAPGARTDWVETRIRFGWPPTTLAVERREKIRARLLHELGAWTARAVLEMVTSATRLGSEIPEAIRQAQRALTDSFPTSRIESVSREHVDAGRSAGYPWNVLATIATELIPDLEELARGLASPDEELQGRLFHLGVLGLVLEALAQRGQRVESIAPLARPTSRGPSYRATGAGPEVLVWYEASGIWRHHARASRYDEIKVGLDLQAAPMSPDIIVTTDSTAIVIECKYSLRSEYAVRNGFLQSCTYALELAPMFKHTVALTVAPNDLIGDRWAQTAMNAQLLAAVCSPTSLEDGLVGLLPAAGDSPATSEARGVFTSPQRATGSTHPSG
jgi:hypothetical protein